MQSSPSVGCRPCVCSCSSVSAARRNHDVSSDCSLLTCSLDVVVYLAHYQASYSLGAHSTVSCSSRRPFGLQTIGMAGENQARFPTCTCTCWYCIVLLCCIHSDGGYLEATILVHWPFFRFSPRTYVVILPAHWLGFGFCLLRFCLCKLRNYTEI